MPLKQSLDFHVGNSFFRNPWVKAPASTRARDGLGPLYNTNACQNCHIRDGRGHLPKNQDDNFVSLIIRLSRPAQNKKDTKKQSKHGPLPIPAYGTQLQDFALPGVPAEGQVSLRWTTLNKTFADGDTIQLRQPHFSISKPGYGDLPSSTVLSARIAPPMIGLGLLAAIEDDTLLQWSDPEDLNNDGISGRINWVNLVGSDLPAIGRFGWKAAQPNLKQQTAAAFLNDMGLTSSIFPAPPCTKVQSECLLAQQRSLPDAKAKPEVSDKILEAVTFYSQNLAVPHNNSPVSKSLERRRAQGHQLFLDAHCAQCHKPEIQTGDLALGWLATRLIQPYTDLLLHDMGDALAGGTEEFSASAREWRTPPLWGIGMTKNVHAEGTFLHDGRARTLMEAIVWHGGEAQAARDKVMTMDSAQRQALITFIQSL